jgi:hypothetical protein
MRARPGTAARIALATVAVALVQGCGSVAYRPSTLPTENSSAHRSMLSRYNKLSSQHRSVDDGVLLKAPEDQKTTGRYFFRFW